VGCFLVSYAPGEIPSISIILCGNYGTEMEKLCTCWSESAQVLTIGTAVALFSLFGGKWSPKFPDMVLKMPLMYNFYLN